MLLGCSNGKSTVSVRALWFFMGALSGSVLLGTPGLAQITSDGSLGVESSVVTPGATVQGLPADLIEGGAARGANLFHSFSDFNVDAGESVYFANPTGIENILSRVTGGNVSTIDGLLGVDGAANLFLLNPNGVVFGPNASLDISGSFVSSTGSHFAFADGSEFSATPTGNELLTVSVPLGVQFNQPVQGDITQQGNLAVGAGETLTLFGDTVLSRGGLTAEGGTVQLVGNRISLVDAASIDVSGSQGGDVRIEGDDVALSSGLIDISGTVTGGDLAVYADDELTLGIAVNAAGGGNALFDPTTFTVDAAEATTIVSTLNGGNAIVEASETITVDAVIDSSGQGNSNTFTFRDENSDNNLTINLNALITLGANQTLTGDGTKVNVNTTTPGIVQNGLDVAASGATVNLAAGTYQEGRQLTLTRDVSLNGAGPATILDGNYSRRVLYVNSGVTATIDDLTISNGLVIGSGSGIFNDGTLTIAGGTISGNTAQFGGGIVNNTDATLIINGGTISDNTADSGGGIVNDGTLTIAGGTISGNTAQFGGGIYNIGTLTITGGIITANEAGFPSNTRGGGIYNERGTVTITGGTISGNNASDGGGIYTEKGTVTITGGTISGNNASNGAGIYNRSLGALTFGGFTVPPVTSTVTITGGTIRGNTASNGGGILNAGTLIITGGTISGNTANDNRVGIVTGGGISNLDSLTMTGGTISGNNAAGGDGIYTATPITITNAGPLTITQNIFSAPEQTGLVPRNQNSPTPRAFGDIRLSSPVSIILSPGVQITSNTTDDRPGGSVIVETPQLILQDGSAISASTSASVQGGKGGSLIFSVSEAIALRGGSLINTQATGSADAGRIQIDTPFLVGDLNGNNDIVATATSGNGGQVVINANSLLGFTPTDEANFAVLRTNSINDISASAQSGNDGTVELNTLEVDLTQGLNELPADLSDRSNQITPGCGIANTDDGSSFVLTGRGGLPPNPSDPISANDIEVGWLTYDGSGSTSPPQQGPDSDNFTQAQAMVIAPDGTVHFIAGAETTTEQQFNQTNAGICATTLQR